MANTTYNDLQKLIYQNKVRRGFNVTDVGKEIMLMTEELGELCEAEIFNRQEDCIDAIGDLMVYCLGLSEMFGWNADGISNRSILRPSRLEYLIDYLPYASMEVGLLAKTYKKSNQKEVGQINLHEDFRQHLGNLIGYCRAMFRFIGADEISVLEKIITNNKTRTHTGSL